MKMLSKEQRTELATLMTLKEYNNFFGFEPVGEVFVNNNFPYLNDFISRLRYYQDIRDSVNKITLLNTCKQMLEELDRESIIKYILSKFDFDMRKQSTARTLKLISGKTLYLPVSEKDFDAISILLCDLYNNEEHNKIFHEIVDIVQAHMLKYTHVLQNRTIQAYMLNRPEIVK